jgi:hypothetical protein
VCSVIIINYLNKICDFKTTDLIIQKKDLFILRYHFNYNVCKNL